MKQIFFLILTLMIGHNSFSQKKFTVTIPQWKDDKYSETVKVLESGKTDINYKTFRESFIESPQFKVAKQSSAFDSLEKAMYAQMEKSNDEEVIRIAKKMLSIDYTSMIAHKILRQTYKIVGDSASAAQYKAIQFGLLNSIVRNGDGKSCSTAWPVVQIEEEYFILKMIDAELKKQSIDTDGGMCDKMVITEEGKTKTYFFETSSVFKGYEKLGFK